MTVPAEVQSAVADRLFADMARLGWNDLSYRERSAQYARWLDDPDIGGRLQAFMNLDRARVWIKDGPVKEWPRALAGIGRFAKLVGLEQHPAVKVVELALGDGWKTDLDSVQIKPLRVTAHRCDEELVVSWGACARF